MRRRKATHQIVRTRSKRRKIYSSDQDHPTFRMPQARMLQYGGRSSSQNTCLLHNQLQAVVLSLQLMYHHRLHHKACSSVSPSLLVRVVTPKVAQCRTALEQEVSSSKSMVRPLVLRHHKQDLDLDHLLQFKGRHLLDLLSHCRASKRFVLPSQQKASRSRILWPALLILRTNEQNSSHLLSVSQG